MRKILLAVILLQTTLARAQSFNEICAKNWYRQELRTPFADLLENPKTISPELTQQLLDQGFIAELELRLLEKALEQKPQLQIHLSEIKTLLAQQQSCENAELLANGIPLKESSFAEIKKSFSYQVELRHEEMPELTKSYDTLEIESKSSRKWLWASAIVGVIAAVYFQRNYEIEY